MDEWPGVLRQKRRLGATSRRLLIPTLALASMLFGAHVGEIPRVDVAILAPSHGSIVEHLDLVRVHVSEAMRPTVLVRPLRRTEWWVQGPASPPTDDGEWELLGNFGTDTEGSGELFHVIAVVGAGPLEEGEILSKVPRATGRSNVVTVRRRGPR